MLVLGGVTSGRVISKKRAIYSCYNTFKNRIFAKIMNFFTENLV